MIKELKQRVKSKAAKIRSYEERNNQYIQNYLFNTNQKCLFEILEGNEQQNKVKPDAEWSKEFWDRNMGQGSSTQ